MRLDYLLPAASLSARLSVYANVSVGAQRIETLPAMLPNLHIRLAGRSRYRFGDGDWIAAPRVTLIGPTTSSYQVELRPGVEMLAAGILPHGWSTLVRISGAQCNDRIIDGELLWGHAAVETLCGELCAAGGYQARAHVLDEFLIRRLCGQLVAPGSTILIDRWIERSSDLSLDELCNELVVGARQLRRLTLESYGVSPKTLAMKYRCLRAAAVLVKHGERGIETALHGFADQAHLTRDFRRFFGWTPLAFVRENRCVAAATFAGRLRAGASRPLALLS